MIALLLQLAVSPVGTWEAETVRVVQGIEVTDHGAITFRADHTYVAARNWPRATPWRSSSSASARRA